MNKISTIGLDLAKSVFQVHGIDSQGRVVVRRQYVLDAPAFGEPVVPLEVVHRYYIVLMHPVARGDRLACKADDLAEFQDRIRGRDGPRRDLVAERDPLTGHKARRNPAPTSILSAATTTLSSELRRSVLPVFLVGSMR